MNEIGQLENNLSLRGLRSGGGTHIAKGYGDVPRSWPFFSGQSPLPSPPIYHQCAALVPRFQFLEKFCFFNHVLTKILAL